MKKLLTCILCVFFLQAAHQTFGQTQNPAAMKDGYAMQEGKMIQIKSGTISPLEEDVTMENGTRIMQDGTVVLPGKKPQKLKEGYAVNNLGKIVLLEYDMMKHEAIREHSRNMLGNTETKIVTTEDGKAVVVEPSGAEEAADMANTIARKSTLISEQNSLVVRKAELLNSMSSKEAQKNEELKTINARLKDLQQELKGIEQQAQVKEE